MTTIANFVTTLGDLAISGVTTKLDEPPTSVKTADLPAQWVEFPRGESAPSTFESHGKLSDVLRAWLIIAIEPYGQNIQSANWSATITMMDSVKNAIAASGQTVAKGKVHWAVRADRHIVNETFYWAVIAEVTANG